MNKATPHIVYAVILIVLVGNFFFIGSHALNTLQEDYTNKIALMQSQYKKEINALKSDLEELKTDIAQKQIQINKLSDDLSQTAIQIEESTKQYEIQIASLNQQIDGLEVESESFSGIIENVINAVVSIVTDKGQGSGAIISKDGYIITNFHVIDGISRASVITYDGQTHLVRLIGYDKQNDIAILQIVEDSTFEYLKFANSDTLKTGQKIVALGNPAGLSFTATEGIISSPSRNINGQTFIQTDVSINPGNSGGPLINAEGNIVGVVNFKIAGYDELGFAIPSNRAEIIANEIIEE